LTGERCAAILRPRRAGKTHSVGWSEGQRAVEPEFELVLASEKVVDTATPV